MSNRLPGAVAAELISARKWLGDIRHWCQDEYESGVWPFKRYCASGYLQKYGSHTGRRLVDEAAKELYNKDNVIVVNDYIGHAATMRVFDRAVTLALSRQM